MSGVRRILLLTLGWEELPKTVSVYGETSGTRLREPVPGILIECDGGWLLVDTGFNSAVVRDRHLYRRFHGGGHGIDAILPPGDGDPLEAACEAEGIAVEQIGAVAVSHLHNDHAGGLRLFAGRVPVHIQRRELEYGLSAHPGPEEHGMFRIDYDDTTIDWRLAEDTVEVAPGVTAIPTPGHTPGHQSFVVDLDPSVGGGGYVFAFDAADLTENLDEELAPGGFIDCTPEQTVEQIRKLKGLAGEKGYQLVPGHDPHVWPVLTATLAERFGHGR